jgi:phospholipid transport system substrate-binding protein
MKRHRPTQVALALALALLTLIVAPGLAGDDKTPGTPLEIVEENTEKVLAILRDPELQGKDNREERREKVREAVQCLFDWEDIARRALGRHWWGRSEKEREEFIPLFQQLLEGTYLNRVEENADADVQYRGQDVEDDKATVQVMAIAGDGTQVPIQYRLRRTSEEEREKKDYVAPWLVYDVKVEGVSLVSNYRSQFNDIIIGSGYDRLVKKLRQKVENQ